MNRPLRALFLVGSSAVFCLAAFAMPTQDPGMAQAPAPQVHAAKKVSKKRHVVRKSSTVAPDSGPEVITEDQVHAITSLPKAPGDTGDAGPVVMGLPGTAAGGTPATGGIPTAIVPLSEGITMPAPAVSSTPSAGAAGGVTAGAAAPIMLYTQPGQQTAGQQTAGQQTAGQQTPGYTPITPAPVSSSSAGSDLVQPTPVRSPVPADVGPPPIQASMLNAPEPRLVDAPTVVRNQPVRPFSAIALQLKVGFAGIGFDVATPLARRFNLRAGASFFSYNGSYNSDGLVINGDVQFRSATAGLDIFPFANGFRITPGVTFYNGNAFNAAVNVPPGVEFDLGDGNPSYSSQTDPIHGTAVMRFGKRVAPSLTIGSGNMIPRNGHHLSFPFEIGAEYIDNPGMTITIAGMGCDAPNEPDPTRCSNVATDPIAQQNLREEVSDINNILHYLRFYPILSFGVAWRFGSWHE